MVPGCPHLEAGLSWGLGNGSAADSLGASGVGRRERREGSGNRTKQEGAGVSAGTPHARVTPAGFGINCGLGL